MRMGDDPGPMSDEYGSGFAAGVASLRMIRCLKHRDVLPYNHTETGGGECAACEVERLATVLMSIAEWGELTPDPGRFGRIEHFRALARGALLPSLSSQEMTPAERDDMGRNEL